MRSDTKVVYLFSKNCRSKAFLNAVSFDSFEMSSRKEFSFSYCYEQDIVRLDADKPSYMLTENKKKLFNFSLLFEIFFWM